MKVKEEELYRPIFELFGGDYFATSAIELGPKEIDIVLESLTTGKLIAIEVKVRKWKQALRQALNYQLGADESYVAIHEKYSRSINPQKFKELGVGLITVDPKGKAEIRIPPIQSPRKQRNYTTLLRAHVAEKRIATASNPSTAPSNQSFKNYLWYVATERRYYEEYADCYDGLMINAHILAHYTSAFSALCLALDKPFFVLPDTHFLQLARPNLFLDTKGGIRASWEKLGNNYGALTKLVLSQGRNLEPSDFVSKTGSFQQSLYDLVENVLYFQKQRVPSAAHGLARFFDAPPTASPSYLVAPNFFFTSIQDPWYAISLELAKESVSHKETHKLFALICTSKSVLISDKAISTIGDDFSGLGLDGVLVWIQDFSEAYEPLPLLQSFRDFVGKLKERDLSVINLYGSFFSFLMHHYGLDGTGYGICYKDSSDPEDFPTGGPPGGPLPKYYLKDIRTKIGKVEAAVALGQFPSLGCSCEICSEELDYMLDAATPDTISRDLMKRHFLICKREEKKYICENTLSQAIADLAKDYGKHRKKAHLVSIDHLKRWAEAAKSP